MDSSILWLLLIGGLMFLMHRGFGHGGGGCGHMDHGGHGHGESGHGPGQRHGAGNAHGESPDYVRHAEGRDVEPDLATGATDMVRDPVCGMMIDPREAAATSEYEGMTYYFCSTACEKNFDNDPARFIVTPSTGDAKADMHGNAHRGGHGATGASGHAGHCC